MRKRIAIGLLAIVVIGVLAIVLSRPRLGTVEWHKREYLAAQKRLYGQTPYDRSKKLYYRLTRGVPPPVPLTPEREELANQLSSNRAALIRLGFLSEREFLLKHRTRGEIIMALITSTNKWVLEMMQRDDEFNHLGMADSTTNPLSITVPREDIPLWEEIIRKMDVPQ